MKFHSGIIQALILAVIEHVPVGGDKETEGRI